MPRKQQGQRQAGRRRLGVGAVPLAGGSLTGSSQCGPPDASTFNTRPLMQPSVGGIEHYWNQANVNSHWPFLDQRSTTHLSSLRE